MNIKNEIQKIVGVINKKESPDTSHLDFRHGCCWRHQLFYKGLGYGQGEEVEVSMKSGRVAVYKCTTTNLPGNTGQKDWLFTFLRYKVGGLEG